MLGCTRARGFTRGTIRQFNKLSLKMKISTLHNVVFIEIARRTLAKCLASHLNFLSVDHDPICAFIQTPTHTHTNAHACLKADILARKFEHFLIFKQPRQFF